MTTSSRKPIWTHDTGTEVYTLINGDIHCWVWRGKGGEWHANVRQHGNLVSASMLPTLESAKRWCERLIAERTR